MTSSGTTNFNLPIADIFVESFGRIQLRTPQLELEHLIEARRSLNIILQDWSANRNVNLWKVQLDYLPLTEGIGTYTLPSSMIQILDTYVRTATVETTAVTLGNAITPATTFGGTPVLTAANEPSVVAPTLGVFDTVSGNSFITMHWTNHGLSAGSAFEFQMPVMAGGVQLSTLNFVDTVTDANTFTFMSPKIPVSTENLAGCPPLFFVTSGSATVSCILINHGLIVGDTFTVQKATTLGGISLAATTYTVVTVPNSYTFTFSQATSATSSFAKFENGGQITVYPQDSDEDPTDIVLSPVSRTEWAAIPDKLMQGRPTTFWFERTITPKIHLWEVPDDAESYGVGIYSMQQIQDGNPVSGQTLDMPNRMMPALVAELTAALAEKYKPEAFMPKLQIAEAAWKRASSSDNEDVPLFIIPGLSGYYR